VTQHDARSKEVLDQLREAIRGPVLSEQPELEPFARDFSGLDTRFPLAATRISSEEDVAKVFHIAARSGVPVALRGAGHSSNGSTLSDGGLVLVNFEPGGEMALEPSTGHVSVSSRASWFDLQEYLVSRGRECPVLTDFLLLSVGGTLSVGGYGARSIANGSQIDNVARIRLVLPNGQPLWCSSTENADLFRFALAGRGAVGFIDRAVLPTIQHTQCTRIYGFELSGLSELARSLEWLQTWKGPPPDWFIGAQRFRPGPEFTIAQYGFDFEPRRPIDAAFLTPLISRQPTWIQVHERVELKAHARTIDLVEAHPGCVRLWADYMFGYAAFSQFAQHVEERLREPRFRRHLSVIGVLIHRSPDAKIDFPFEASSSTLGRYKYMVGFYFFVPSGEEGDIAYVRDALQDLLTCCLELGGRPYRYGVADLTVSQRTQVLGTAPEDVTTVLNEYAAPWPTQSAAPVL
jgi:FAD/FMN-containing dehydrogenase